MARVTVEDCVLKVPNRFDLVLMAACRSRQISSGSPALIARDDDKNPVVSLRKSLKMRLGLMSWTLLLSRACRGMLRLTSLRTMISIACPLKPPRKLGP